MVKNLPCNARNTGSIPGPRKIPRLPATEPVHRPQSHRNKRNHCNGKPAHHNEEQPLLITARKNPHSSKDPAPSRNKINGMGREVGGVFEMGNTCKSMADSSQCMAKTTTIL